MQVANLFHRRNLSGLLITCIASLLLSTTAFSDEWWVIMPDGAVRNGYNRRQGPFASQAAAEAYWRGERMAGTPNIIRISTGNPPPPPDNSSEIIREREVEELRLRAEKERLEKERLAEAERRQQEIEFNDKKSEAVRSLKGGGNGDPQLKTAGTIVDKSPGGFGLKGLGDTGIKDVPRDKEMRDLGGAESAWKQLNAAAYLSKAASSKTDPVEMLYLATETSKVMNGEALGVSLAGMKMQPMPRPSTAVEPGAEYREATKLILADVSHKADEMKQKAAVVVDLAQKKAVAVATTRAAQETLEKAVAAPLPPVPAPDSGSTAKPKPSAVEVAKAALLAAQQAEADATRLLERADAEAKFKAQEINASLRTLEDLDKNPALATSVKEKYQRSPVVGEPNK